MSYRRGIAGLAFLLALGACTTSPPPRFYALAPTDEGAAPGDGTMSLAVGPVVVAEYLKRPQIVTRLTDTELELADFHQWVEPFDILFPRVLAQNLAAELGTDRVSLTPVPRDVRVDRLVEVDVVRFDATVGKAVTLDALWRVYGRDGERLVEQSRTIVTRELPAPTEGRSTYVDIVQAMSEATGELAARIAEAVRPAASG